MTSTRVRDARLGTGSGVGPTSRVDDPGTKQYYATLPKLTEDIISSPYTLLWKTLAEPFIALILLIPTLPVVCLLVMIVRLVSPGPGLFRQARVGRDGRIFTLFKIRTMRLDAEERTGAVWSTADDDRVFPFGRFLRVSHLDELPQLFNVLLGHMSLVGPRPERPEFVTKLAEQVPGYLHRLAVRPGVTGLAQIAQGPDRDLATVRRKLELDSNYIESMGVWLDARIIVCTALQFLRVPYELARTITLLEAMTAEPQNETVPTELE